MHALLAAGVLMTMLGPADGRPRYTSAFEAAPTAPYFVGWRVLVDEPEMLEWKPRQAASPLPDAGGGRIYVPTNDGAIFCVEDGQVLWSFQGEGAFEGAPRAAPGTLYAGSTGGRLYALNSANGKVVWSYDTKEDLGTQPAVAGGRVIVASLSDAVIAAEAATGAFAWQYRRESSGLFTIRGAASPAAVGEVVYTAFSDGHVVALSIADGSVRWDTALPAGAGDYVDVDGGPVVAGDKVFVAGFSAGAVALDARTGKVAWRAAIPGASQLAIEGPRVIVSASSQVVALRRADGAVLWRYQLAGQASRPVVDRGLVAFAALDGAMYFLEAASGRLRGTFQPGTGFSAPPAARGGAMYALSNGGSLFALGLAR